MADATKQTKPSFLHDEYMPEEEYRAGFNPPLSKAAARKARQLGTAPPWIEVHRQIFYHRAGTAEHLRKQLRYPVRARRAASRQAERHASE